MTGTPPPAWRQLWDRLALYLPVVLMGLLALGSYWVVRLVPTPAPPGPPRPVVHEPDYRMLGFAVRSFNAQGQVQHEVRGTEMRHYPDTDTLEIDQARLRALRPDGGLTTAQSQRLTVNAAQTDYRLQGQVRVERHPGPTGPALTFEGEALRLQTDTQRLSSDLPVRLTRGSDTIVANRLRYEDAQRVAELEGQVRATLVPR